MIVSHSLTSEFESTVIIRVVAGSKSVRDSQL